MSKRKGSYNTDELGRTRKWQMRRNMDLQVEARLEDIISESSSSEKTENTDAIMTNVPCDLAQLLLDNRQTSAGNLKASSSNDSNQPTWNPVKDCSELCVNTDADHNVIPAVEQEEPIVGEEAHFNMDFNGDAEGDGLNAHPMDDDIEENGGELPEEEESSDDLQSDESDETNSSLSEEEDREFFPRMNLQENDQEPNPDGNVVDQGDEPLYEGAPITVMESMLSILTLSLVHNLTGSCLSDILGVIYLHCKKPTLFKNTLYKFRTYFDHLKSPIKKHFYCNHCYRYLENQNMPCRCGDQKKLSFFIEISLAHQLDALFKRVGFYEALQHRFHRRTTDCTISDVYDGSLYKKFFKPGRLLFGQNNISFMWYSDGIPIFKSRKYSLWPMYLIINELPYHKRILPENMIVAGLWFGPTDPVVNLFLKPLHSEFETLGTTGIEIDIPGTDNPINVKSILLFGTGDTPARCDFQCHVRFNGNYGCTLCNEKGYTISGESFGNTHIYPFEGPFVKRSQKETDERAVIACNTGRPVYGVKGPSLLSKIMPDAVNGVCIDVMHCVFLGVVKKLMHLWFEPKWRFENFSLYRYLNVIDARLSNLSPPSFVQRVPRSISKHMSYFKASEYKNFFFYYSLPILHDMMEQVYLDHYLKLIFAIFLLSSENITDAMLMRANDFVVAFVSQFQAVYGGQFMSINVHLLRHLPDTVRRSGPLWVTSCFPFEDFNGKLGKKVHGTTHIGLQVYSAVAHSIVLPYLLSKQPDSESKTFCQRLLANNRRQRLHEISDKIYIVGRVNYVSVVPFQVGHLLEIKGIRFNKVGLFHRLRRGKHVFYSKYYSRSVLHLSYCVMIESNGGEIKRFGTIQNFVQICQCDTRDCNANCVKEYYAVVEKGIVSKCFSASSSMIVGADETMYALPYMYSYNPQPEVVLEQISRLKYTCFLMKVRAKHFLAQPVNLHETE